MDKHNKHHKNKDKASGKPQSPQLNASLPQEQVGGKGAEPTAPGQKSKSDKGKQK